MTKLIQLSFDSTVNLPMSVYDYGARSSGETHGVVLTRPHVVSLILDLAGYTIDSDLTSLALLEPACGDGAFVVQAVERLLKVARLRGAEVEELQAPITAFDIAQEHVARSREAVVALLEQHGMALRKASSLAARWIHHGDFLLNTPARRFDVVVGNPPYVRIEQLAPALRAEYCRRYRSLYDRADLYVAFIEKALFLLPPNGVLSFICADRWIANKYGAPT